MKNNYITFYLISWFIAMAICITILFMTMYAGLDNWNNGVCSNCGNGHYQFIDSYTRYYYFPRYIYECDNCKCHIELNKLY
jgi:hypothetical protein